MRASSNLCSVAVCSTAMIGRVQIPGRFLPLLSVFCFLLSAFCLLLSAFRFLPSAFCLLITSGSRQPTSNRRSVDRVFDNQQQLQASECVENRATRFRSHKSHCRRSAIRGSWRFLVHHWSLQVDPTQ